MIEIWRGSDRISQFFLDIVKFSTYVFNKVVRWDEWGEVENEYIEYNFSYFVIYIPKLLKLI